MIRSGELRHLTAGGITDHQHGLQITVDGKLGKADWMRPLDDRILEVLQTAGITLSPAIIAYNLDMSREAVNRRLAELAEQGLVEKIKRGRCEIAHPGEPYLDGNPLVETLRSLGTTLDRWKLKKHVQDSRRRVLK